MKESILLLFPPVWLPEAPFLSTPTLTAYLRQRGVPVRQLDLNVGFWQRFMEPEQIRQIHFNARRTWRHMNQKGRITTDEARIAPALSPAVGLPERQFVEEVVAGIIPLVEYRRLVQFVSEFSLNYVDSTPLPPTANKVQGYHDLLYSDVSYSTFAHSVEDLLSIIEGELENPFERYFSHEVIPYLKRTPPLLAGISIAGISQVVPGLTLAKLIKSHFQCHVSIGGSWCTHVHQSFWPHLPRLPFLDSMVIYEGEEPLYRLWQLLSSGRRGSSPEQVSPDIPNTYTNHDGKVTRPIGRFTANLTLLPPPDFSDFQLSDYDSPETITFQASRGCYWGRCTFCSYPLLEPTYKALSPELVLERLMELRSKLEFDEVGFVDALISPRFARRFSRLLRENNILIRWNIFARFERAFTEDLLSLMGDAGCSMVSWGLESGSAEILELIDKSIDLRAAAKILAKSAHAGIHNRVLVMYGHPTEDYQQALQTVSFIDANIKNIHSISYNIYHPEINTPIEALAARLGIDLIRPNENDLSLSYAWSSSMTSEELREIKERFEKRTMLIRLNGRRGLTDPAERILTGPTSFCIPFHGPEGHVVTLASSIVKVNGAPQRQTFYIQQYP